MADETPATNPDADPGAPRPAVPPPDWAVSALGIGLLLLATVIAYCFASVWPSDFGADTAGNAHSRVTWLATTRGFDTTADVRLILMVMLAGGMGSFLHTATSFSDFVGNGKLARSWMWWYVLKPFIGMGLALLFYLVVRGGFLTAATEAGKINVYGIAALGGMAGMFSKQATDKLNEVFTTVFRTAPGAGDDQRSGDLANGVPVLQDVVPSVFATATQMLDVEVKGSHFSRGSVVRIGGEDRPTTFIDDTRLAASLLPSDVEKDTVLALSVFNPRPGGGVSATLKLTVAAVTNP